MAAWKLLENIMLQLKKAGVSIPPKVVEDLRTAKSMLKIACTKDRPNGVAQKAEDYLASVEAYLMTQGQKTFGEEQVERWLRQLEEVSIEISTAPTGGEDAFVVGVPRNQTWFRMDPMGKWTKEKIEQLAQEQSLQVKNQIDGKLVVYGHPEKVTTFLKQIRQTFESQER